MRAQKGEIVVAVSGGFDPVHIGHVRMFNEAKKLGDRLIVILNNDNWLRYKKGYVFMSEEERAEIIEAFTAVDEVFITKHATKTKDISVCEALRELSDSIHIFANGGDRWQDDIPEAILCKECGIEAVFNVGRGGKVQSSSELVQKAQKNREASKQH